MLRIAVTAQPRGVGLVNTIGFYKGQPYASDFVRAHVRKGIVLNNDGHPSPCVHQYDRVSRSFALPSTNRTADFVRKVGDRIGDSRFDTKETLALKMKRAEEAPAEFEGFAALPLPDLDFKALGDSRNSRG